jgi:hypothetical protein
MTYTIGTLIISATGILIVASMDTQQTSNFKWAKIFVVVSAAFVVSSSFVQLTQFFTRAGSVIYRVHNFSEYESRILETLLEPGDSPTESEKPPSSQ